MKPSLYLGLRPDDRLFIARSAATTASKMSPRAIIRVRTSTDSQRAIVESSLGGCVSGADWFKLFELASRAALKGQGIKAYPQSSWRRGHVEIGGYTVKRVYRNGDVKVGCQTIKYLDIVRAAFSIEALLNLGNHPLPVPKS